MNAIEVKGDINIQLLNKGHFQQTNKQTNKPAYVNIVCNPGLCSTQNHYYSISYTIYKQ